MSRLKMNRVMVAGLLLLFLKQASVFGAESCADLHVSNGQFIKASTSGEVWVDYNLGLSGYWYAAIVAENSGSASIDVFIKPDSGDLKKCSLSLEGSFSSWVPLSAQRFGEVILRVKFLDGTFSGGTTTGLENPYKLTTGGELSGPIPTMRVNSDGSLGFELPPPNNGNNNSILKRLLGL